MGKRKKRPGKLRRFLLACLGVLLLSGVIISYTFYRKIYAPNVNFGRDKEYLYIPTGTNYQELLNILSEGKIVSRIEHFSWMAQQMNLASNIHPGRYKLEPGMSNYQLVTLLRSGKQEPVKLVINKFRLKEDIAGFVSSRLEADSSVLVASLNDEVYLRRFNLTPQTAMTLFIPNTYELYWNTSDDQFLMRMKKEYDRFWNDDRKTKATALGLTPAEVITLASIVEEETNYNPEKGRIARVYLNRIRKSMLLQADPTVKFALKDFSIKRIYHSHLVFDSPYNTYLNKGLPPGPICTPSVKSIDAVLGAEANDYLYFCASVDSPGTHVFARTYQQHLLNASRYQKHLNEQGT